MIIFVTTSSAYEEIMDGFNLRYNTFNTRLDTCDICHVPVKSQKSCDEICHNDKPIKLKKQNQNPYGVEINLSMDGMDKAFEVIENLDSDKDGFANIGEIHNLTFPGDKKDFPNKKKNNILSTKLLDFDEIVKSILFG